VASIRQQIFEVLSDGNARSAGEIADEVAAKYGRKRESVIVACSNELHVDRRIARTGSKPYRYKLTSP
jgi:hypothetical protein